MLVFTSNRDLSLPSWDSEYSLVISKRFLTKCFRLIDSNGVIAHESTLYKFTPLGISLGYFGKIIGNCKTHNDHRGKGLFGAVVAYIAVNYCVHSPIVFVEENNIASIRGLQKVGFSKKNRFVIKKKYFAGLFYSIKND